MAHTPLHPIDTATKTQHLEMAKAALAAVYEKANLTEPVSSDFHAKLADLHLRVAELTA